MLIDNFVLKNICVILYARIRKSFASHIVNERVSSKLVTTVLVPGILTVMHSGIELRGEGRGWVVGCGCVGVGVGVGVGSGWGGGGGGGGVISCNGDFSYSVSRTKLAQLINHSKSTNLYRDGIMVTIKKRSRAQLLTRGFFFAELNYFNDCSAYYSIMHIHNNKS